MKLNNKNNKLTFSMDNLFYLTMDSIVLDFENPFVLYKDDIKKLNKKREQDKKRMIAANTKQGFSYARNKDYALTIEDAKIDFISKKNNQVTKECSIDHFNLSIKNDYVVLKFNLADTVVCLELDKDAFNNEDFLVKRTLLDSTIFNFNL